MQLTDATTTVKTARLAQIDNHINDVSYTALAVESKGRIVSSIEALKTSQESLVKSHLFIFISSTVNALDGRIVSLDPSASLVSDVFKQYACETDGGSVTDVAFESIEMCRNGIRISLEEELSNGDVLTLPPSAIDLINIDSNQINPDS